MSGLYSRVDGHLVQLASLLDEAPRKRLLELLQADSRAARLVDVEHDLQRAEDLAAECRRQMHVAQRQLDRTRAALEVRDVDIDGLRRDLGVQVRSRPAFRASRPDEVDPPPLTMRERVERAVARGRE